MHIRILGTAAAEGWPALFCGCETCRRARAAGGKDLRSRASLQIDDIFKIDLPPDTYHHMTRFGLDLSKLAHLFFTHSHEDHFALNELDYLRPPFAHDLAYAPVRIYGNATVIGAIDSALGHVGLPVELVRVEPFVRVRAGHLTFTPVIATHKPSEECLNYVIQSDSATVLYAADTGLYGQPTMDHLSAFKFDMLIVECTQGARDMPSNSHMGLAGVVQLRDDLAASGAVTSSTRIVLTHFSHNMGLLHEEFAEVAGREGMEVAYDGVSFEF